MRFVHAASVISAAMVKFLFSPPISYGFGHNYWQTVLLTTIGGWLSVALFYPAGLTVLKWLRKRSLRRRAKAIAQGRPPKRTFTRMNRAIVRMKKEYGMQGLTFALMPLLSVPVTALLAAKYFRKQKGTMAGLMGAVGIWSLILSGLWKLIV